MNLTVLQPDWPASPGVRAAMTARSGGVSTGAFAALNLGAHVGDVPAAVAENRRRLRAALGLPAEPLWLQQVHGVAVCDPDSVAAESPPRADAAVTRCVGRVLAIQVADCMPVLFASKAGDAVGAAHAGWRGLASGVLENTVSALAVPAAQLHAWLGPTISAPHFEVGDEVRAAFLAADAGAVIAFERNARGRWQCDLVLLARRRLERLGLASISGGERCTYAEAERFFSYRRDGQTGRMAALVWLQA